MKTLAFLLCFRFTLQLSAGCQKKKKKPSVKEKTKKQLNASKGCLMTSSQVISQVRLRSWKVSGHSSKWLNEGVPQSSAHVQKNSHCLCVTALVSVVNFTNYSPPLIFGSYNSLMSKWHWVQIKLGSCVVMLSLWTITIRNRVRNTLLIPEGKLLQLLLQLLPFKSPRKYARNKQE